MRALPMAGTRPNSTRRVRSAPTSRWAALQLGSVVACLCLILAAMLAPGLSLTLFWRVFTPLAPIVFLVAPGLWRNICPMATLNGMPGRLGRSRMLRPSARVQRAAPAISACLFCAIVPLRTVVLDQSGAALAVFLLLVLAMPLLAGLLYGGKGGWCNHICPMGAVERLYGHSPLLVIRDTHCRPCVGCARHCADLNPTRAHLAELQGGERGVRIARLAFAGAMPWLCVAFFTQPALPHPAVGAVLLLYGRMWSLTAVGAGLGLLLPVLLRLSPYQVIRAHAVTALNLYCLFALPPAWPRVGFLLLLEVIAVALLSCLWLGTAAQRERVFVAGRFLLDVRGSRRGAANAQV